MVKKLSTKKFIELLNKKLRSKQITKKTAVLMLRGKKASCSRKKKTANKNEVLLRKEIRKHLKK